VGYLRVEENLEEQITEFFGELGVVGGIEGVEDLIGFLNQVGAERGVGLFAVPRAATRGTEARHDANQLLESRSNSGGF
jgi:hypothetical protein